ncbi:hypothetical protein [Mesorhizobium sp. 131-2-1]|uniref:hypothetical protein n=1 Tax=Mesorhizobium sp. 131-2-1 TaxID=2744518 RepID=UPI0019281848|nr:hypothetical protein [Mesorhizobium sp. 131-2-1]
MTAAHPIKIRFSDGRLMLVCSISDAETALGGAWENKKMTTFKEAERLLVAATEGECKPKVLSGVQKGCTRAAHAPIDGTDLASQDSMMNLFDHHSSEENTTGLLPLLPPPATCQAMGATRSSASTAFRMGLEWRAVVHSKM